MVPRYTIFQAIVENCFRSFIGTYTSTDYKEN